MYRTVLIGFILLSILKVNSQDDSDHFNKGLSCFNNGNYMKALEQFDLAIQSNPNNKVYYFNRGITFIHLDDTCKSCADFHKSFELGYIPAGKLIRINCLSCDSISYNYYKAAQTEINKGNYIVADSLLSLSIENNLYLVSGFQRGLIRLDLGDTLGFCSDMRSVYSLDVAAKANCQSFCTDTLFFDKTFTERTDRSDYYEVIYKPGFGAVYNRKNKSFIPLFTNPYSDQYWVNAYMIGYYKIIDDEPVYLIAEIDPGYQSKITDFFNRKKNALKDTLVTEILQRNGLKEYKFFANIIVSQDGSISKVIIPSNTNAQLLGFSNKNDLITLNEILLDKLNKLGKQAPTAKPAKIGKRTVSFQYNIWITLKI